MDTFKYQVINSTPTLAMAVRVRADREYAPGLIVARGEVNLEDAALPDYNEADACFVTSFLFDTLPFDVGHALQGDDIIRGEEVVVGRAKPGVTTAEELLSAALRVPAGSVSSYSASVPSGSSLWDVFADSARFADAEFVEASLWEWAADAVDSASPGAPVKPRAQRWQPSRKRRK